MLKGFTGMTAEVARIDRLRKADLTGAHASATGYVEAQRKPKRPPVSEDKPRDLEHDEVEDRQDPDQVKGHKAILRELARHISEFHVPSDQVEVRDVQPAELADSASCHPVSGAERRIAFGDATGDTILPAGQPEVPDPPEMVDPCPPPPLGKMHLSLDAHRDPGVNLPGKPQVLDDRAGPHKTGPQHHAPGFSPAFRPPPDAQSINRGYLKPGRAANSPSNRDCPLWPSPRARCRSPGLLRS